jgi:hypothetical protein
VAYFTIEILQAINDWQRGGDHKQKLRRGGKLKQLADTLPKKFQSCSDTCYRQEAHEKDRIWKILADQSLPETIAAWTTDLSISQSFKNGVPPNGLQGVIFSLMPPPESVVINLVEVYRDPDFMNAISQHKSQITGFGNGIGRYGKTQHEVVLELRELGPETIHCYGGYASDRETLAERCLGHKPNAEELKAFNEICHQANTPESGAWWLSQDGTRNVLDRMGPKIERLRQVKS